jgi:hypothetical protein
MQTDDHYAVIAGRKIGWRRTHGRKQTTSIIIETGGPDFELLAITRSAAR